jgi:sugar O-acyltransferase (sialic acid O-acetyltransferase NeuD family)
MTDLVILGSGGFAKEVAWITDGWGWMPTLGFINEDPTSHGQIVCGLPVLGSFEWFDKNRDVLAICGVGSNNLRRKFVTQIEEKGINFATVVSKNCLWWSEFIEIGEGTVITHGNILTADIVIGKHTIVNLNCTIGHDSVIGDFVNISPGCNISGNVTIKDGADIGTGAKIIQGVTIGQNATVGAGSVVIKDVPDNATAVGVPAKVIKVSTND